MAQIDVSDLLLDPDFIDPMSKISRVPTVNSFGENTLAETTVNSFGSIQPASGQTIQRIPEAMRVDNMRSFWFKGEIVASSNGKYSDVLVFKNQRYNIITVFDWMNYGQGWCEGLCVAEKLAP